MKSIVRNFLVPLLVLLCGAGIAASIMGSAEPEAEFVPETELVRVGVVQLESEQRTIQVQASGRVEAGQRLSLIPQVTGTVVWLHPELTAGGRLSAGEEILRIDPTDYRAGVQAEQSRVSQAALELQLENQRGEEAARSWVMVKGDEEPESLVLREPHRDAAEKALKGAQSSERIAQLSLDRTTLIAPFDLSVISESVDLGQLLIAGQPVASLIGTEYFLVRASVPIEQLAHVQIPGAAAELRQPGTGENRAWEGTVERLSSELEALSHTAQLSIRVDQPLESIERAPPLLVGSYVDIEIVGELATVVPVPRHALHPGNRVWTVDSEDLLQPVDLVELWSDSEFLYASSGLSSGVRVVTTPLSLPLAGQPVEVVDP
jgi:RND family efflux transporter MFP subunit